MHLRRLSFLWLVFALLLGQHGAMAHALSHLGGSVPAKEALSHSPACDKCLVYEQVGGAVVASGPPPVAAAVPDVWQAARSAAVVPAARRAAKARGPPRVLA